MQGIASRCYVGILAAEVRFFRWWLQRRKSRSLKAISDLRTKRSLVQSKQYIMHII